MFFSPLRDAQVPQADCLYLGGGYPELYADALEKNSSMRGSIRAAVQRGVPVFAECGGFMYLNALLDGREMCGVLGGECFDCGKLVRFGYCTLKLKRDCLLGPAGGELRAHEFHYYDCTENGSDAAAVRGGGKPSLPGRGRKACGGVSARSLLRKSCLRGTLLPRLSKPPRKAGCGAKIAEKESNVLIFAGRCKKMVKSVCKAGENMFEAMPYDEEKYQRAKNIGTNLQNLCTAWGCLRSSSAASRGCPMRAA